MATEYDVAAVLNILKEKWGPRIVELFNISNDFYDLIWAGPKERMVGKGIRVPFRYAPNPSGAAGGGKSPIPKAGVSQWDSFLFNSTYYRNRFMLWHEVLDLSRGEGGFIEGRSNAMMECQDGVKRMLNTDMLFGRQAGIATCAGVAAGEGTTGVVTCKNAYVATLLECRGTRYLTPGQRVQVINPATGAVRARTVADAGVGVGVFIINTVDSITGVTLDDIPAALADDDIITRENEFNYPADGIPTLADPIGHQLMGLDEIIAASTDVSTLLLQNYGGVDRSVRTITQSYVKALGLAGAGANLNMKDLRQAAGGVRAKFGNRGGGLSGPNAAWIVHPAVEEFYYDSIEGDTRYAPLQARQGIPTDQQTINIGDGNKHFAAIDTMPPSALFMVDRGHLERHTLREIGFDRTGGAVSKQYSSGGNDYDAEWGFMTWGGGLVSDAPNAHAKLLNIQGIDDLYGQGEDFVVLH